MPIKIEEVGKMGFTAEVTPPDGGGRYWKTPHPMDMQELIPALKALGCTQDDIRHAFDELGEEHYRRMAALTEPVVEGALAGACEIPPQRPGTEAWLGYALYYYSKPISLREVIESADAVNHLIPNPDEVAWAFLRLRERGWLIVQENMYGLTEEGRLAIGSIVNEGVVERLDKWISANPSPATITWIRSYVEEKRTKGE
jgi:hypothetical protein